MTFVQQSIWAINFLIITYHPFYELEPQFIFFHSIGNFLLFKKDLKISFEGLQIEL